MELSSTETSDKARRFLSRSMASWMNCSISGGRGFMRCLGQERQSHDCHMTREYQHSQSQTWLKGQEVRRASRQLVQVGQPCRSERHEVM